MKRTCGRDRSGGEAVPERSGGMEVARSAYGTTDSPIFAERSETKSHPKNKKENLKLSHRLFMEEK